MHVIDCLTSAVTAAAVNVIVSALVQGFQLLRKIRVSDTDAHGTLKVSSCPLLRSANVDDRSICEAYKELFETLEVKEYKPKINVMDTQATKNIKKFLTTKGCDLQVVEPHTHWVNAAERAIQTFKDAFIAALAMTDSDFPLQLWDKITPQVQDTLNLMRASRVDPTKSAYEILNGPYNWNRYPLAPLGCKAVIYEDGDT